MLLIGTFSKPAKIKIDRTQFYFLPKCGISTDKRSLWDIQKCSKKFERFERVIFEIV
jgi:hypothetical protein